MAAKEDEIPNSQCLLTRSKSRSLPSISSTNGEDDERETVGSGDEGKGKLPPEGKDMEKAKSSPRMREKSDKKDQALYATLSLPKSDVALLIEHMNNLQKRWEATLMGALSLNKNKIEGGLKKVEKKMNMIADSLSEVKGNLTELENKVKMDLSSIQNSITTFEQKLEKTQARLETNEERCEAENRVLRALIESVDERMLNETQENANIKRDLMAEVASVKQECLTEVANVKQECLEMSGACGKSAAQTDDR